MTTLLSAHPVEDHVRAALGRLELAGLAERDAWGWRLAGATRRGGAAP